jgi:hypothetical protein
MVLRSIRTNIQFVVGVKTAGGWSSSFLPFRPTNIRGCILKLPVWVDNEINNNNNKQSRSNIKGYGGETYYTDSQNSDTTVPSGRELYDLQFSLHAAGPETFGYTLVWGTTEPEVSKSWQRTAEGWKFLGKFTHMSVAGSDPIHKFNVPYQKNMARL